ncbi:MAG: hypothetical protein K2H09_06730 [Treponemataceae bacterium]|nr:hypothetical protein [Treponemataceae bacterium]
MDHSPVRYFDQITGGGLKAGEMGLVTAKKGLGKTSVLVQFGIDTLLHDKHLVHVSFDQHSSNVISWYDSILAEIGKKKNLGDMAELSESIVRERTILNFNQETFTLPKVVNTIKALKEGGIQISAIVIDGADLSKLGADDVKAVSDFVKAEGMTAWFSDTNESDKLSETLGKDVLPFFDIVGHLAPQSGSVVLSVLKAGGAEGSDAKVRLDSKTLLMSK